METGSVVQQRNSRAGNVSAGWIEDYSTNGPGRAILGEAGEGQRNQCNQRQEATQHGFTPQRSESSLDGRRSSYSTARPSSSVIFAENLQRVPASGILIGFIAQQLAFSDWHLVIRSPNQ